MDKKWKYVLFKHIDYSVEIRRLRKRIAEEKPNEWALESVKKRQNRKVKRLRKELKEIKAERLERFQPRLF